MQAPPDPFAAATSDNAAYVAPGPPPPPPGAPEREREAAPPSPPEGGGAAATAPERGGGDTPTSASSHPPVAPGPDPVVALLPPEERDRRRAEEAALAAADGARKAGLPVTVAEPGDDGATLRLKSRLAREHLKVEEERGSHGLALGFLTDVVEGKVKATEDGEEADLHPRHRIAAAKALVQAGQRATKDAPIHVDNANIIAAGDVVASVDPERLAEAVRKMRERARGA